MVTNDCESTIFDERPKSKLLTDPEIRERFLSVANFYAKSMAENYVVVSTVYDPENVVGDVIKKVLMYGIDFDMSKGTGFNGFVRMLVNREYIDIYRRMKRECNTFSLDSCPDYEGATAFAQVLQAPSRDMADVEDEVVMEQFFVRLSEQKRKVKPKNEKPSKVVPISLEEVLKLKLKGYTNKDIANLYKVKPSRVNNMIARNRDMLWDLCNVCFGEYVCMPAR